MNGNDETGSLFNPPPYAQGWAFFMDVDGTLLEFAEHPGAVVLPEGLLDVLADLVAVCAGAVALISGRTLADLDRLFAPLRLPAAGLHGCERRDAAGHLHHYTATTLALRTARDAMEKFVRAHPGTLLEDKGAGFALHYRAAPACAAAAVAEMEALKTELGEDYRLQYGKMVVEIRPAVHDKGSAVMAFLQEPPFAGREPVFIGDDVTDEDGFRQVRACGGKAVKVGPGATLAEWRLPDTAAVCEWLRGYVRFTRHAGGRRQALPEG